MATIQYSHPGFCPCCEKHVIFSSTSVWYRDFLHCPECTSIVRERALALILEEVAPRWREADIHESSPSNSGISAKLYAQAHNYIASHFYPKLKLGENVGTFRNENLENQTFEKESFDLVVTLDVMEHVFDPARVYQEIYRTLRPGGIYLHTFPIKKEQTADAIRRAELKPDGSVSHLTETPEYHGNPIDTAGALVTFDYGYDITQRIAEWAPFDVRIVRFWDEWHGIIGEFTEVVICRKTA